MLRGVYSRREGTADEYGVFLRHGYVRCEELPLLLKDDRSKFLDGSMEQD